MAKILIIDDEPEIVSILGEFLRKKNFEVIECEGGRQGIDKINSGEPFDLLLLDIKMPGVDGPGILEELRKQGRKVPVILITGTVRDYSKKLGVDVILRKPVDLNELLSKINELLGIKQI
ncbi:MAG: response regulator [Candidatus Omnitrophota bacterium]